MSLCALHKDMFIVQVRVKEIRLAWLMASTAFMLSACSGGSAPSAGDSPRPGTASVPITVSVPPPRTVPAPPAAPGPAQPASVFDTAEYRTNGKLALFDPTIAYARGITGRGVTVAVLDTGVDTDSAEFAGRLAAGSGNFLPGGVFDDVDGHGTAVSSVILGAKNNAGTHGVAFEATLFSGRILGNFLRSRPSPPSRAEVQQENVDFYNGFANSLNAARTAGAQAVNLSIGFESVTVSNPGSPPPPSAPHDNAFAQYEAAVTASLRDGVVFVIAAGNDGATRPNSFPRQILAAVPNRDGEAPVLIVGALGEDGQSLATFSDRAGTGREASFYIAAPGVRIAAPDDTGIVANFSGTSLAAPHVTGALALVLQAFPNLTAPRAADLLLTTATDLGAPGTDAIFGRGALNLARAFQPQGAQRLPTLGGAIDLTPTQISLGQDGLFLGAAVAGKAAFQEALDKAIFLDAYDRVFQTTLSPRIRTRTAQPLAAVAQANINIYSALETAQFSVVTSAQKTFSGAPDNRLRGVQSMAKINITPDIGVWFSTGAADRSTESILITQQPSHLFESGRNNIASGVAFSIAGVDFGAQWRKSEQDALLGPAQTSSSTAFDFSLGQQHDNLRWQTRVSFQRGVGTTRTPRDSPLFFASQKSSRATADILLGMHLSNIDITATAQLGRTQLQTDGALITGASPLITSAFSVQAGVPFAQNQKFTFGIAQPLRVESGSVSLTVPTDYNYALAQPIYVQSTIALSPRLREIDLEMNYQWLWDNRLELRSGIYHRFNPAHKSGRDSGAMINIRAAF